jgi:TPR repeat protein
MPSPFLGLRSGVRRFVVAIAIAMGVAFATSQLAAQTGSPAPDCGRVDADTCMLLRGLDAAERFVHARALSNDQSATDALERRALHLLSASCIAGEGDGCYFAARLDMTRIGSELAATAASSDPIDSGAIRTAANLLARGCDVAARPSGAACNELAELYYFYYGSGGTDRSDTSMVYYARGCALGNVTTCARWGIRLEAYPELGPSRFLRAAAIGHQTCSAGSMLGCMNEQVRLDTALNATHFDARQTGVYAQMGRVSFQLALDGCRMGASGACYSLGAIYSSGRYAVAQDSAKARYYYERACKGSSIPVKSSHLHPRRDTTYTAAGYPFACISLGRAILAADPGRTAAADSAYQAGCTLLYADACAEHALLLYQTFGSNDDSAHVAYTTAVAGCFVRSANSCRYAGWMLLRSPQLDPGRASVWLHRACDLADGWGCTLSVQPWSSAADSIKYLRRACGLDDGTGCFTLGEVVDAKFGLTAQADTLYTKGCALRIAGACWNAMLRAHARGDAVKEGVYRTMACRFGKPTYCKPNRRIG